MGKNIIFYMSKLQLINGHITKLKHLPLNLNLAMKTKKFSISRNSSGNIVEDEKTGKKEFFHTRKLKKS